MPDTYTCSDCGGTFETERSDEAAHEEAVRNFGRRGDSGGMALVCDDCYKRILGEIGAERREVRDALNDPTDGLYEGIQIFLATYASAPESTRRFMRMIAPYMFDENGNLLYVDDGATKH
jgi:hypothetical protein